MGEADPRKMLIKYTPSYSTGKKTPACMQSVYGNHTGSGLFPFICLQTVFLVCSAFQEYPLKTYFLVCSRWQGAGRCQVTARRRSGGAEEIGCQNSSNKITRTGAGTFANKVQIIMRLETLHDVDWLESWTHSWEDVTIGACMKGLPWQNDSCHGGKAHYGLLLE